MSQGFEVRVGTWNTWERGMYPKRAGEKERYDLQVEVMRTEFPCHVWAVQEIGNVKAFRKLADDLACTAWSAGRVGGAGPGRCSTPEATGSGSA